MISEFKKKVAELIRIEFNQETGEMKIILEVLDNSFKQKILHNKEYCDILTIVGRDAIIIANKNGD